MLKPILMATAMASLMTNSSARAPRKVSLADIPGNELCKQGLTRHAKRLGEGLSLGSAVSMFPDISPAAKATIHGIDTFMKDNNVTLVCFDPPTPYPGLGQAFPISMGDNASHPTIGIIYNFELLNQAYNETSSSDAPNIQAASVLEHEAWHAYYLNMGYQTGYEVEFDRSSEQFKGVIPGAQFRALLGDYMQHGFMFPYMKKAGLSLHFLHFNPKKHNLKDYTLSVINKHLNKKGDISAIFNDCIDTTLTVELQISQYPERLSQKDYSDIRKRFVLVFTSRFMSVLAEQFRANTERAVKAIVKHSADFAKHIKSSYSMKGIPSKNASQVLPNPDEYASLWINLIDEFEHIAQEQMGNVNATDHALTFSYFKHTNCGNTAVYKADSSYLLKVSHHL